MYWKESLKGKKPFDLHDKKSFELEFPEVKENRCWKCAYSGIYYFPSEGYTVRCNDPHIEYSCKYAPEDIRINHFATEEQASLIALFSDEEKGLNTWYKYKSFSTEELLKKANLEILDEETPTDDTEIFHWTDGEKTYVTTDVKKLPKHYYGGIVFRALVVYHHASLAS